MKNLFKILILSLLFISISLCQSVNIFEDEIIESTSIISIDKLFLRGEVYYSYNPYQGYTGKIVKFSLGTEIFFREDNLKTNDIYEDRIFVDYEGYLKNGLKHGKFINWKGYGIYEIFNYKNGLLHGEYIQYRRLFPDKIFVKGQYKNNNKTGEWIHYKVNGKIKSSEIF